MLAGSSAAPAAAAASGRFSLGARIQPSVPCREQGARGSRVAARALEQNVVVSLLSSTSAAAVAAGVTIATAENRDRQLELVQELDIPTVGPIGAAVLADTLVHSNGVLSVLLGVPSEPIGAAAGVAYMMSLVLSSSTVDPKTLAPEGTILGAQKAMDSRASLRVPFTKIAPTALKVIDMKNEASSGAGWTIGEEGLPRLPINSVLIVLGVGVAILEAASHAPVLGAFMPRVLQVAAWIAAAGYGFEVLGLDKPSTPRAEVEPAKEAEPAKESEPAKEAEPTKEAEPAKKAEPAMEKESSS